MIRYSRIKDKTPHHQNNIGSDRIKNKYLFTERSLILTENTASCASVEGEDE